MPGHIKKTSGPDPDPSPWLEVKKELRQKLLEKPYDMKKSCWVVNKGEDGGFLEGLVQQDMMVADWEAVGKVFQANLNYLLSLYFQARK